MTAFQERSGQSIHHSRRCRRGLIACIGVMIATLATAAMGWFYLPRKLEIHIPMPFAIVIKGERWEIPVPSEAAYVTAGNYQNELAAFLQYEYLRSQPVMEGHEVQLVDREDTGAPRYEIRIQVGRDLVRSIPYTASLHAAHLIPESDLHYSTMAEMLKGRKETRIFTSAYLGPVTRQLEQLSVRELLPPVATFLRFKSTVDSRTHSVNLSSLSSKDAHQLAADIITVAEFYSIPLDVFLGIGAMENNYLNVDGDLQHTVWKRHFQKGDIVLKRRRRRVLVLNYSIGRWQITRETVRYAHRLFLRDHRDYTELPDRLRPRRKLVFEQLDPHVMTTYAGLLVRDLLDHFPNSVADAIGAYNGGPRKPNLGYAAGVFQVAQYVRSILEHSAALKPSATLELQGPMARQEQAATGPSLSKPFVYPAIVK